MELKNTVAVVTGANRGLGRHLAAQLVERGAKVYAAARRPETVDLPGVIPLRLDVTDQESIREAARVASDATLLVNNAGISTGAHAGRRAAWTRCAWRWRPTSSARSP